MPKASVEQTMSNGVKKKLDMFYAELSIMKSTIARGGKGVYANCLISPGDFISKYDGEKIGLWEADKRRDQVTSVCFPIFILSRLGVCQR